MNQLGAQISMNFCVVENLVRNQEVGNLNPLPPIVSNAEPKTLGY
jgi:hypothetical protein